MIEKLIQNQNDNWKRDCRCHRGDGDISSAKQNDRKDDETDDASDGIKRKQHPGSRANPWHLGQ